MSLGGVPRASSVSADLDLEEAIRASLGVSSSSAISRGGSGDSGGTAALQRAALVPTACIDVRGSIQLLSCAGGAGSGAQPRPGVDDLVLEDLSVVPAHSWALDASGTVVVTQGPAPAAAPRGLPAPDAAVKWCCACGHVIDGRFNRNAWAWRCAPCQVDLCTPCFEAPRPCTHEYEGLPPGGGAGGARPRGPGRPPKPGRL